MGTLACAAAVWIAGQEVAFAQNKVLESAWSSPGTVAIAAPNSGLQLDPESGPSAGLANLLTPDESTDTATKRSERNVPIGRRSGDGIGARSKVPWYRSGLAALSIVLAVVAGAAWLAKRFLRSSQGAGGEALKVVCRTHLSPKQSIALMQMGSRFVFVGITPERISTILTVDDEEEAATLRGRLRVQRAAHGKDRFDDLLTRQADELNTLLGADNEEPIRSAKQIGEVRSSLQALRERLHTFHDRTPKRGTDAEPRDRSSAKTKA